jgi:hypothetical protein
LYSANTVGSILGALLAGFWRLRNMFVKTKIVQLKYFIIKKGLKVR